MTIDELLDKLRNDFPDELPMAELSPFEYGKLVGIQTMIEIVETYANEVY